MVTLRDFEGGPDMRGLLVTIDDLICVCPFGTVSGYADFDAGILWIFSENDPHPRDWSIALEAMIKLGTDEPPDGAFADGEVLVYVKRMRPEVCAGMTSHTVLCPPDCDHVNVWSHSSWCPKRCRHVRRSSWLSAALAVASVLAAIGLGLVHVGYNDHDRDDRPRIVQVSRFARVRPASRRNGRPVPGQITHT